MVIDRRGRVRRILGRRVEDVLHAYSEVRQARRESQALRRSPWASGSFYLALFLAIMAALLVVARLLPAWVVPVVVVGGLLGVAVVGAYQLRQDDKLSERGFLRLMIAAVGKLPASLTRRETNREPPAEGTQRP